MKWVLDSVARWPWVAVPALLTAAGVVVFAGVAAGLVPIKASSGHWAVTEWFLHFAMRRSVVMHARFAPAPPEELDGDAMALRGAGHFETGCRPCHGAPGDRLPVIPHAMTPHPPELGPRMHTWDARELFYIVKHGVKFTGMPAWPSQQRDDEVWAMVAFLRRLPELDEREYDQLIRGEGTALTEMLAGGAADLRPPDVVLEICARCHGIDGNGRGVGAFPKLAGQRFDYMKRQMHAYADGRRFSGIMQPLAANLPEDAQSEALHYYASLAPMTIEPAIMHDDSAARGAIIARNDVAQPEVPACAACHSAPDVLEAYPRLHGQYGEYLAQQLRLLQQRQRGGSEFVDLMHSFVDRLSADQIRDLAAYFSTQRALP